MDSLPLPLLLDTDIGSNIDDALALAYLLRQPSCDLMGITTVTGDVAQRAACAEVICREAGRTDTPIHCGARGPLPGGSMQPAVPHYQAIGDLPHRLDRPPGRAIEFLCQTIRARPGQITLLTLGPLTNVAILFAIDPEIPSLLKQVVSMIGVYFSHERDRETNCGLDPVAAEIVFRSAVARHVCIGLDVTTRCRMAGEEFRRTFDVPGMEPVMRMADVYLRSANEVRFNDPLAAAAIFRPELCRSVQGNVEVELDSDPRAIGQTRFAASQAGRHEVAVDVDVAAFFAEYKRVIQDRRIEV